MHTYEEIRDVVVDILIGREQVEYEPSQWEHLKLGIAMVFARREGRLVPGQHRPQRLDAQEAELARDVFWDMFRQGFITLGLNDSNPAWPFFRLSHFGKNALQQGNPYRFTDTASYIAMVKTYIPDLDDVTRMYLEEAVSAFYASCLLASCVMVGVAIESRFLLMLKSIEASAVHSATFRAVSRERTILQKITKFKNLLEPLTRTLPTETREDLDTQFNTILSVIRTSRNESGHPTGKRIERDSMYILLQLFAPCARKLAQLQSFFR